MTNRLIALLGVLLAAALLGCAPGGEAAPVGSIGPEELARRIADGDPPFILDVRSAEEFGAGHIPGAVNIPHAELGARIYELPDAPADELIVHCESGRRARTAEETLVGAGFTAVRDLDGHMSGWREGGYPVE